MIAQQRGNFCTRFHCFRDPFILASFYGGRNGQPGDDLAVGIAYQGANAADPHFGFFIVAGITQAGGFQAVLQQGVDSNVRILIIYPALKVVIS